MNSKNNTLYRDGYAKIGSVVSMRHRFQQFLNEPYDIVHPKQTFGYINAKYRPCLIVGHTKTHVILAPIKRTEHKPRWLEVENGGYILPESSIKRTRLNQHCEGMAIGCAELRQIPKSEFTYQRIIGILPTSSYNRYIKLLTAYMANRQQSTHPLQWQFDADQPEDLEFLKNKNLWVQWQNPINTSRIHPNDVLILLTKAQQQLNQFTSTHDLKNLTPRQETRHNNLKKTVTKLLEEQDQYFELTKAELSEHYSAIEHGYGDNPSQVRHHSYLKNSADV